MGPRLRGDDQQLLHVLDFATVQKRFLDVQPSLLARLNLRHVFVDEFQDNNPIQFALHTGWLQEAGAIVSSGVAVEISPLFALDCDELAEKVPAGTRIDKPTYFADTRALGLARGAGMALPPGARTAPFGAALPGQRPEISRHRPAHAPRAALGPDAGRSVMA